jgi:beta-glucosidase
MPDIKPLMSQLTLEEKIGSGYKVSHSQAALRILMGAMVILLIAAACTAPAPAAPTTRSSATAMLATATPAPTIAPLPTNTLLPAAPQSAAPLAPEGEPGKTYYAPFPLTINLDGDLSDWHGVPTVTLPHGSKPTDQPGLTFAAAADDKFLYLAGNVTKPNIISGQHGANYWNEDSVEFYVNGTGELGLRNYKNGVAQITIPALNIDHTGDAVISGVNGATVDAKVAAKKTAAGYAVEVAVPLKNKVWNITPTHGGTLGFQAHLNGATKADRDIKLIWSLADQSDHSYQDPSLFGQLIFYRAGKTDRPVFQPTVTPTPQPTLAPPSADAPYKNPKLPVEDRVNDLLGRMTLAEKIGQMTQIEKNSLTGAVVASEFIGSVLSGGGGYPNINKADRWAGMTDGFQKNALATRLGISEIYGADAVHGHNNVRGAVIFPHNIGLGAAADEDLMRRIGQVTAGEMVATGVKWNFAPVIAVPQDIRWGRTYEGYSENTDLVSRLGTAYLQGLQGKSLSDPLSVLGTLKHYIGDGGTAWGTSTTENYKLDQGVAQVDEATLRALFLPPYQAGLKAGARSVMASFSSWGGMKMHAQKYLLTDVLKGELGFDGFVVSDWGGVDQISPDYYSSVVTATNAGIDMHMVPYDYSRFINTLTQAVQNGDVPMSRIDDAVRRILRVKFELGLFEHPNSVEAQLPQVGSKEHRAVAREAVAKSLVLLKNEQSALPLSKSAPLIYVAGIGANDIGMQSGGWTIEWQGQMGNITPGTTIYQAISNTVKPGTVVKYDSQGNFPAGKVADACVAVVGEQPYAEGRGDKADLSLALADMKMTEGMRDKCQKLIVIMISGRPMIVTDQLKDWDAFVAAWLPGTEGQGVADVLFGDKPFTGKLPYTWPRANDQLPFDFKNPGSGEAGPLFPFGYGLVP